MSHDEHLLSLPFLKPWWQKAKLVVKRLFEANTVDRLRRRLHILSQCDIPHLKSDPFVNLCTYLEDNIPLADKIHFLEKIFPTILYLVLNLEDHPEEWSTLSCLVRNRGSEIIVRRTTLASLLATSFLCLLPQDATHCSNFEKLFHNLHSETAREKLKCFINYFDVLSQQIPNNQFLGAVKITRRVLPGWCSWTQQHLQESTCNLSAVKICRESKVEDYPSEILKVGQFSRQIGNAVWEPSCTTEDVLICRSPEILGCSFLCETMADNEALELNGCSVFSQTKGLSTSFEFVSSAVTVSGTVKMNYSNLCAIDAQDFQGIPIESQFSEECVIREINKCYIGLLPQSKLPQRRIKISALSRYAQKLSSNIFNEAKIQAQTMQFRTKAHNRRKVAEAFADTVMNTLVKGLPVSLKHRMPNVGGALSNSSPPLGMTQLKNGQVSENVTVTLTPADDQALTRQQRSESNAFSQESPPTAAPVLERTKALEDFAELFVSNLFKIVVDQLFPKMTRKMFFSKRRRSSSRTVSLSQSFSLYDIVKPLEDTKENKDIANDNKSNGAWGLLKPVTGGGPLNRADEQSNFFLGDIEEVSADFVTDTSDWSSRGSGKYKSKLPLSKSVAAETFYRGRKFASIRDQYSNIVATQILAEAIASYINTLAKKNSSTGSSLSPRLESSLSEETRRGSGIHSVDEYADYLSEGIIVEALQSWGTGRIAKSLNNQFFDQAYEELDYDSYSLHSRQLNPRHLNAPSLSSSNQRRRGSYRRGSTASTQSINERLYSFFVIALFFKVWSLFVTLSQSFSKHYRQPEIEHLDRRRDSNVSAILLETASDRVHFGPGGGGSKRPSLDLSVDEHGNQIMTSSRSRAPRASFSRKGEEKIDIVATLSVAVNERERSDVLPPKEPQVAEMYNVHRSGVDLVKSESKSLGSTFSLNSAAQQSSSTFLPASEDLPARRDLLTVATQTFGSVSFGGDAQFKFFILWISASLAGMDQLLFHPCANSKLNEVEDIIKLVTSNGATVADLYELLNKYCNYIDLFKSYDSKKQPKTFFTFLQNFYS